MVSKCSIKAPHPPPEEFFLSFSEKGSIVRWSLFSAEHTADRDAVIKHDEMQLFLAVHHAHGELPEPDFAHKFW